MAPTQSEPLITSFREGHTLMRATALVILCCFCVVFYSPAVHATLKTIEDHYRYQPDNPLFGNLNTALNETQILVARFQPLVSGKQRPSDQQQAEFKARLDNLIGRFETLDADAQDYFDNQQTLYKERAMPEKVMATLIQRQDRYHRDMASLQRQLGRLTKANEYAVLQNEVGFTASLLNRLYRKPTHHPYDQSMPFGTLDSSVRVPYTTAAELQALLGAAAPAQPITEDQLATIDAPITAAIQQQAATLGNDPVAIYNWVYNTIEFIPSYGSIQGADYTLQSQKGNAIDIASLLIALLRSAGTPARYHYGTVHVDIDEVMNWVGGVSVTSAAHNLLGQGGIPSLLQRVNGVDSHFEIEHVWVDIWDGNQWLQVDPSYKQYTYIDGIDIQAEVPFDAQTFATSLENGLVVNETEGWVQSVNQTYIQTEMDDYRAALETYLTNQQPNATLGDLIGSKQIQTISGTTLPAQLPYLQVVVEQSITALPDALRHKFVFELSDTNNNPFFDHTLNTVELVGKKLAMSFRPATAVDEQALINYLPANPQTPEDIPNTIPANLFNVIGEFSVDGQVLASSAALSFGQELNTTKGLWSPKTGWETTTNPIITGEYQAIGVDLHGLSPQQFSNLETTLQSTENRVNANDFTNLTKHEIVGDLLQTGVMSFMAMTHIQNQLYAQKSEIVYYREPSYGAFSTKARLNYLFGQPQNVEMTGVLMDMDRVKSSAECEVNCWDDWRDFNQSTGAILSAYEHLIPEQLFSTASDPVESISAVKALALAGSQGQRIYKIDQGNLNTALTALTFNDSAVTQEITTQVNAGYVVTVHQDSLNHAGWSGVGYTVLDPQTGAGAYKISGGSDGGEAVLGALNGLLGFLGVSVDTAGVLNDLSNGVFGPLLDGLAKALSFLSFVGGIVDTASNPACSIFWARYLIVVQTFLSVLSIGAAAGAAVIGFPVLLAFFVLIAMSIAMSQVISSATSAVCRPGD